MTINWPTTPALDQEITGPRGEVWKWDGQKWVSLGAGGGANVATQEWVTQQIAAAMPTLPLSIAQGGTSSTTAINARAYLGVQYLTYTFVVPGKPAAGQIYNLNNKLSTTLQQLSVICTTAPSQAATFQLMKLFMGDGSTAPVVTSIMSVQIGQGRFSAVINIPGTPTITTNDSLQLIAPVPQDATLSDVSVTVYAGRV